MALADYIIQAESGGNSYARNPRSSAGGLGQFIDATWLDVLSRYRPDLVSGRSRDELLSLKTDPQLSREMVDAYAAQNGSALQAAGFPSTDGTKYLAHFAGPQGAINVLSADPSASVGSILGKGAMAANPFLAGMTAGELTAWADRKMGGNAPAPIDRIAGSPIMSPATQPAEAGLPLAVAPIMSPQDGSTTGVRSNDMAALNAYLARIDDEQTRMAANSGQKPRIDLAKVYAELKQAPASRRGFYPKG